MEEFKDTQKSNFVSSITLGILRTCMGNIDRITMQMETFSQMNHVDFSLKKAAVLSSIHEVCFPMDTAASSSQMNIVDSCVESDRGKEYTGLAS